MWSFSRSKAKSKVHQEPKTRSGKDKILCGVCGSEKNILTLACKHKCCVKCFNKNRYCVECDKNNTKWCFCC